MAIKLLYGFALGVTLIAASPQFGWRSGPSGHPEGSWDHHEDSWDHHKGSWGHGNGHHNNDDNGLAYPKQRGPDYDYTGFTQSQQERADAAVEQFRFAWDGYYEYAFPHDDLLPKTNSYADPFNGWGVTAVDSLDTAIIMQQTDIVATILAYIPTVDFTRQKAAAVDPISSNPTSTSVFETNIRYIGGMLSGYDLLKGPFAHLVAEGDEGKVDALLSQAATLADTLKFAFETPTGIPVNNVYIGNQTFADRSRLADGTYSAGLAEIGTLVLEWQHLSDLIGDRSYGELAQKAESYIFNAAEIRPGLTGGNFSIQIGEVIEDYDGWTSGNDSAYEYLLKVYVYDPSRYQAYGDRWRAAADSALAYLLSHPSTRPDLTMAAAFTGIQLQNYTDRLACFMGGNFILGSTVLSQPSYLGAGLAFAEFCANGYRETAVGIGPVLYSWNTSVLEQPEYANQTDLYEMAGWFIPDNTAFGNGKAPEPLESWYYAYQVTGDQYWRDVAWVYTLAQNATERVGSGFSNVNNVLVPGGNGTENYMQSFMLAEVLKYQCLIQTEEKGPWEPEFGEGNENAFVYTNEAHPFKVAGKG